MRNKKVRIREGRTRYIPAPLFQRRIVIVTSPWHIALIAVAVVIGTSISFSRALDIISAASTLGALFFIGYCRKQVARLKDELHHAASGTLINLDGDTIDVEDIAPTVEGRFSDDAPSTVIRLSEHNTET